MIYVTFQPETVATELKNKKDYYSNNYAYKDIKQEFGYNPIFLIQLKDKIDFLIKLFYSSPSKSDCMIVTEIDKVDYIDAAKWYEQKGGEKNHQSLKTSDHFNCELEYITDKILYKNVKEIYNVDELLGSFKKFTDASNKSKMLVNVPSMWNIIDKYFDKDERDIRKFVNHQGFHNIIGEFYNIMKQKNSQEYTMKWFRHNIEEFSEGFEWF